MSHHGSSRAKNSLRLLAMLCVAVCAVIMSASSALAQGVAGADRILTPGVPVSGALNAQNVAQVYTFQGAAGDVVNITAVNADGQGLALLLTLLVPLMVLVMTPFVRPFRWSRLAMTYLIPVLPLVMLFDGLVSCLRTYSVQELCELTARLEAHHYRWDIGAVKGKASPIPVTYLIGVPCDIRSLRD